MTARANGHSYVSRALRDSLDRMVQENREMRRRLLEERARRDARREPVGKHCGFCGAQVCECGLEGWVGG